MLILLICLDFNESGEELQYLFAAFGAFSILNELIDNALYYWIKKLNPN